MKKIAEHRLQLAKEKLRIKLSYEKLIQLPQYSKLNIEQYEQLITSVEVICIVLIDSYINGTNF